MQAGPKLLINWEPRWKGFKASVRPALSRSKPRLELECRSGTRFGSHSVASVLLHVFSILWVATIGAEHMRGSGYIPVEEFNPDDYEVVYYSAKELPQMMDAGGAQAGESGRSGGRTLKSESNQVIRIARGPGLMKAISDAPNINLPTNPNAANLLIPSAPSMPVPPAPEVARLRADALVLPADAIRPAPEVQRDSRSLPTLSATAVEPAADARRDQKSTVTPLTTAVQPQPDVKRDRTAAVSLALSAVEPAPDVRRTEAARLAVPKNVDIIPPSPQMRRDGVANPKLALPSGLAVQPPPSVARGGDRLQAGILDSLAKGIIPPNVSVVSVGSIGGTGGGGRGAGGGVAPGGAASGRDPNGVPGGSPSGSGVAVSSTPGTALGLPSGGGPGSLAISPNGGAQPGYGGSGGGSGIGVGTGTGSGATGTGPGSAKSGAGLGAGAATFGITLGPGPGGSGSGTGEPGGIAGVTVIGGNNSVHIPSFGGGTGDGPSNPPRMPGDKRRPPAVTVIATSRSGGAVNRYGALKGSKVYTVYVETDAGLVAVQFSNKAGAPSEFQQDLTPPEPDSTNLPKTLKKARALVSCVLDREGKLANIRMLEYSGMEKEKFVALLALWRMRPVLAGANPVEVDVILALNADTN